MQILSCPLFLKKSLTGQTLYPLRRVVSIASLLILSAGCSQAPSAVRQLPALLPNLASDANFQIRVTPSPQKGVYTVAGRTNLPNESRITVAAIRYLNPKQPPALGVSPKPTFSILAYQDVKVNQGKWQTTLNLWKTAPNGRFQETWQLEQSKLGLTFEPEPDVLFLATVDPTDSFSELEKQLEKQGIELVSNVVRNTAEGDRYVQASQVLPVALATGQTTPPKQRPEDINGGWGPRYLLLPEPPNINKLPRPDKRRIDAPLSPEEFMH
jgi:hypothetical protein